MNSKIKVQTYPVILKDFTLESIRYHRMGSIFQMEGIKYLLVKREVFNIPQQLQDEQKMYGYVKLCNFEGEIEFWFLPDGIKTKETEYL